MPETAALDIIMGGRVQGVGYRPFVARLALSLGLCGWVRNRAGEVEIRAEGLADQLRCFRDGLVTQAPPLAAPVLKQANTAELSHPAGFRIVESLPGSGPSVHLPPDYFVCEDCLRELSSPGERRYRYPFINCTQCGPRYTLIDYLPYDRENTAMAPFRLCPACSQEYEDLQDRRYHAQPLACPQCGPRLTLQDTQGMKGDAVKPPDGETMAKNVNERALDACIQALRDGLIVAVKGIGGYHLLVDAANDAAVSRLRQHKHRPHRPLAILVPWRGQDGLAMADSLAEIEAAERERLCSPERPIVLVKKTASAWPLSPAIAPGLAEVGLMLPYSPLHHLLADGFGGPLVATSANPGGEPVLTENNEVESRLGQVADLCLHHDRPIRRPADDSVYRRVAGRLMPIRLGRGSAPLEWELPFTVPEPTLALGADLKNTLALAFGKRLVVSPHVGTLGSPRSRAVFSQLADDLPRLYGVRPARIVCDAHPDYYSNRWADGFGLPVQRVFHHHAHASALAGEHGPLDDWIVLAWDGTGYGPDGTLWGGETLVGRCGYWQRAGSLRPFRLPGGDLASREPWRCACAIVWEAGLEWEDCPRDTRIIRQAWLHGVNTIHSTSAGRLFDAAAALAGVIGETTFEGQAAMMLEAISHDRGRAVPLRHHADASGLWVSDWSPLLPVLMDRDTPASEKGAILHASLAEAIRMQAERQRRIHGINQVGLTGGVFQNRILTEAACARLQDAGFRVFLPTRIPPNDGGISFGQVFEALGQAGIPGESRSDVG